MKELNQKEIQFVGGSGLIADFGKNLLEGPSQAVGQFVGETSGYLVGVAVKETANIVTGAVGQTVQVTTQVGGATVQAVTGVGSFIGHTIFG
ncbi:hypothetical protein [Acinetobacter lactucae]|uniref:hypothetical protein n=1 Tax=Acinetobacter lactucae TaxID=1785128 RepID=UPI00077E1115|nr:hypothetical protein [Acinetobacter lactucae]